MFLLSSQFPYVHDQPLAVIQMVNGFHFHHCGLDPGLILSDTKVQNSKLIHMEHIIGLQMLLLVHPTWFKSKLN